MKYLMSEIDPHAIKATNIRTVKKSQLKTLMESLLKDGQQYPIIIRPLTPAEREESKARMIADIDAAIAKAKSEKTKDKLATLKNAEPARYGIIDGHTRYMAATYLKPRWTEIEAAIRNEESDEIEKAKAYRANVARVDMAKWEKGRYLVEIMDKLIAADPEKYSKNKIQAIKDAAKEIGIGISYGYQIKRAYDQYLAKESGKEDTAAANEEKYAVLVQKLRTDIFDIIDNTSKVRSTAEKIEVIENIKAMKQALDVIKDRYETAKDVKDQYELDKKKAAAEYEKTGIKPAVTRLTKDNNKYLTKATSLPQSGSTPKPFLERLKKKK